MKTLPLLLLLSLISGCGSPLFKKHVIKHPKGVTRQFSTTDATFTPFIEEFKKAHQKVFGQPNLISVSHIPINFGNPENEDYEGVCHIYFDKTREILIRKDWWDRYANEKSQTHRRLMIFHELGHCYLDREHNNEKITVENDEYNLSLMSSVLIPSNDYKNFMSYYDYELFKSDDSPLRSAFLKVD